jgi:large subunit ribosomal protein L35
MPKMKSNSGAKKRFRLTGTGKVRRASANKRHNLTHKSKTRLRNLRKNKIVDCAQELQVKRMLPYQH